MDLHSALGIPDFRKICEPSYVATRNFHGQWCADSAVLKSSLLPARARRRLQRPAASACRLAQRDHAVGALRADPSKVAAVAREDGGTRISVEAGERRQISANFGSHAWEQIPGCKRGTEIHPSSQFGKSPWITCTERQARRLPARDRPSSDNITAGRIALTTALLATR